MVCKCTYISAITWYKEFTTRSKKIYYRKELIPLRLLRFLLVLNFTKLIKNGIKFIVNKKLSVYNGRINKFINLNFK